MSTDAKKGPSPGRCLPPAYGHLVIFFLIIARLYYRYNIGGEFNDAGAILAAIEPITARIAPCLNEPILYLFSPS